MYLVVVACLGAAVPGPYFFGDLFCGVAEGDQLFAARQHDRIEKRLIPCHLDQSQRQLTRRTGVRLDELLNRWRQIIARKVSAAPDVTRDILRSVSGNCAIASKAIWLAAVAWKN
jgi:hypothetical protein